MKIGKKAPLYIYSIKSSSINGESFLSLLKGPYHIDKIFYQCDRVPLRDIILDMVRTESFLVLLLGGNEGFKWLENVDLVFNQKERHANNSYKDF